MQAGRPMSPISPSPRVSTVYMTELLQDLPNDRKEARQVRDTLPVENGDGGEFDHLVDDREFDLRLTDSAEASQGAGEVLLGPDKKKAGADSDADPHDETRS